MFPYEGEHLAELVKPDQDGWARTFELREMGRAEFAVAAQLQAKNRCYLAPWSASAPPGYGEKVPAYSEYVRRCLTESVAGTMLPLLMVVNGEGVGQLTVSDIVRGATQSASIGYWISHSASKRGVTTLAVALALDAAFEELNLHRVEINVRPENKPSLAVVRKLSLVEEGYRRAYICINGKWADHRSFAAIRDEVPGGYVRLLEERIRTKPLR